MARPSNTQKRRSVQTGGFLSKFRRAIRTRTQKLTNRIPLSYIARFKKAFPNGEITDTGYKYLIMGIGDNNLLELLARESKANLPEGSNVSFGLDKYNSTNSNSLHKLIPIDTITRKSLNTLELQHKLIAHLHRNYKIAYISKTGNNITVTQYPDFEGPIANYSYSGIRIFIYKPSAPKYNEVVSGPRKLADSRSRLSSRSRSRSLSRSLSRLSSQAPN